MQTKIGFLNENAMLKYRGKKKFFVIVLDKSFILLLRISWCDGEFKAT